MLDASKYGQYFPDELHEASAAETATATARYAVTPPPSLLAALSRLEKEFSEILRAQQAEAAGRSD